MNLYIRVDSNKQPIEHPILEENFLLCFPQIDINNLPPEFAKFERVSAPKLGPYEKNLRVQYELHPDGIFRDVWYKDTMSHEEILTIQNEVKLAWSSNSFAPKSFIFNEEKCLFEPPIPYPSDGKIYQWDEATVTWKEVI
jgi:hypothetical protein